MLGKGRQETGCVYYEHSIQLFQRELSTTAKAASKVLSPQLLRGFRVQKTISSSEEPPGDLKVSCRNAQVWRLQEAEPL